MGHPHHSEPLIVVPVSPEQGELRPSHPGAAGGREDPQLVEAEAEFEAMPTEVDPPFRAEPPPSSELEPPRR